MTTALHTCAWRVGPRHEKHTVEPIASKRGRSYALSELNQNERHITPVSDSMSRHHEAKPRFALRAICKLASVRFTPTA